MELYGGIARPGCPICGATTGLVRCSGCKVVHYCTAEHHKAHRPRHKEACTIVKTARRKLEHEETALRISPFDGSDDPGNPFETGVGLFWRIEETRPYMLARMGLADALRWIDSKPAVEQSLNHLTDMMRLCPRDDLRARDWIPMLLLRLGREQECYNFLRWWAGHDTAKYSPATYPRADPYESVDFLRSGQSRLSLAHLVTLTLLKLRLQLKVLDYGSAPDRSLSRIVQARLRPFDVSEEAEQLGEQYRRLLHLVHEANPHFWGLLLDHHSLQALKLPNQYPPGSKEEALLALDHCRKGWDESKYAISMIKSDTVELIAAHKKFLGLSDSTEDVSNWEMMRGTGKVFPTSFVTAPTTSPTKIFRSAWVDACQGNRYISLDNHKEIVVFTDGACSNNGQPDPRAGWAVVYGPTTRSDGDSSHVAAGRLQAKGPFGDEHVVTSNRAELQAAISALRVCDWRNKGFESIIIALDSAYVADGATRFAKTWASNGWRTQNGAAVKNRDLWEHFQGEVERWSDRGLRVKLWKIPREFNGDADAAAKRASRLETPVKPSQPPVPAVQKGPAHVLIICLERQSIFLCCWIDLLVEITSRATVELISNTEDALAALNRRPPPGIILFADEGLARNHKVLRRVISNLISGATVVLCGFFSNFVSQTEFDRLFATVGLSWTHGHFYGTTQILHRDVVGPRLACELPAACIQEALYVSNVESSECWYTPDDAPSQSSAVLTTVGCGKLGYVGEVNGEESSIKVVLAMCGLL